MTCHKRGFSLVELIVVIGIIAILAGVLFSSFGGATDSARSAQCMANLRALAMGAQAAAMSGDWYPSAGSCELLQMKSDGTEIYKHQKGWISWQCQGKYENDKGEPYASAHCQNEVLPFYYNKDTAEKAHFALTNGALWVACNRNQSIYTCPEHVRFRKQRQLPKAYFSYVMNARFGWDYTEGSSAIPSDYVGVYYGTLKRADKTLLFAELPTTDVENPGDTGRSDPTGLKADSVLQYKDIASAKGTKGVYASEDADAESIGFVHKSGKTKRCAHVVFADGHTEELVWREGGMDTKELTAYLCRGWDVVFDGSNGWAPATGADEVE